MKLQTFLPIEQLAWILPHFCCPDCHHIDFLIDGEELPQWLKFSIDYLNKEGGFECKLCGRVYQSLGFLDTHLLKIECVPKETIAEFRIINCRQRAETTDIEKLKKIISNESLRKEWTDEEIAKLIELRIAGKTNEEIANVFNKKVSAISSKVYNLIREGKLAKLRLDWTDEETTKLIELRNAGKSHKEIAVEMNKSASCISQKSSKLIQEGKIQKQHNTTNDDELIAYVKEFYHISSMAEIGRIFGLTSNAVYMRLKKKIGKDWIKLLGLNKPVKIKKPKSCKKEKVKVKLIAEDKRKAWTKKDTDMLFSCKDMHKIAKTLGRSIGSCYVKRSEIRNKRRKKK